MMKTPGRDAKPKRNTPPKGHAVRSLDDVAKIVGMSHEGVAKAERRAFEKIRKSLLEDSQIRRYVEEVIHGR